MKISKEIADVMGWKLTGTGKQSRYVSKKKCIFYLTDRNEKTKWYVAKLLQVMMVDDGWLLIIRNSSDKKYSAEATLNPCDMETIESDWLDTEPAAIVELFKKVYGIK